jgi:glutamyl-tRNA synthetase
LNPREEKEARELIKKIVLLNALRYEGKAAQKPVLGKLLGEYPQFRRQIEEVTPIINDIVQEINSLPLKKQKEILEEKWPKALTEEKIEETKQLPPLPNIETYERVVTRFSPNPDFVLHLGSARAIILSHEYAKIYNGIFILRFEDTDSKTKKPKLEFYEAIREDLEWLRCKWDSEFIQSDRLSIYYKYAEELIKAGNAYVCTCIRKMFQEKSRASQSCPCRMLSIEENLVRWNKMLDRTYGEGEAVVRVKTDLDHPNPAVRDWPALRIIDGKKYPHPRMGSKYRVWPLYNFSTAVDDHLMGVTHIIRGKEHLTNQARQEYMFRHFGWKYPETIHYGRLKITGASLSKSEIVKGMNSGKYKHWDDPRLATLAALRRRGITPEAIHSLMVDVGPKTADVVLSWKNLYAYNRKQIDSHAKRYFFVHDPVRILVKNVPHAFTAQIQLHPDYPEKGFRCFEVKPVTGEVAFLISKDDLDTVKKRQMIRFMDLFNFRVEKVEKASIQATFLGESYEKAKKVRAPLIHWIPADSGVPCKVVMPDASVAEGIAEEACRMLEQDEIIQFQRFGFVRIDNVNEKLTAYFAHR